MRQSPLSIVLTDPLQDDNPITYVSEAFERTTLYARDDVIGKNCRFLQGPDTDPRDVDTLRDCIAAGEQCEVTLVNHKADGTPFVNQLLISPVHDAAGHLIAFFGLQRELASGTGDAKAAEVRAKQEMSGEMLRELQHRVKNHLAMVVGMIRMQARRDVTQDSFRSLSRRIEALSLLYEELFAMNIDGQSGQTIDVGAYLDRIARAIAGIEGRDTIRADIDCDAVTLDVDRAARLGLLLSELMTNALEHAFPDAEQGSVRVRFAPAEDDTLRLVVEDDGRGLPDGSEWPHGAASVRTQTDRARSAEGSLDTTGKAGSAGVGGSIVVSLAQSLDGRIDVERGAEAGTRVSVTFNRIA